MYSFLYDISDDDQKVKYLQDCAELISSLGSSVQREVYSARVAEKAKITFDAMKLEVNRAFKRRIAREKKKQEKIDLAPAQALQPKTRSVRYDNMRSAMAEESVIAMILRDATALDSVKNLSPEAFSVPLLGRVFGQLRQRHDLHMEVSVAVLEDLEPDEVSHLTAMLHRHQGPVNQQALADCVAVILSERSKRSGAEDLLALRNRMKERKGINE